MDYEKWINKYGNALKQGEIGGKHKYVPEGKRHGPTERMLNAHNKCTKGHTCKSYLSLGSQ
jgi:hypothetical protein